MKQKQTTLLKTSLDSIKANRHSDGSERYWITVNKNGDSGESVSILLDRKQLRELAQNIKDLVQ